MLLLGLGAGMAFNPMLLAAMSDVEPGDAGLASGVVNTAFMMGGALGLAVLASAAAARTGMEYGALEYVECIADDVKPGKLTSFPQSVKLKADETVAFSWIVYKSRKHRDTVNAKVMADPRIASMDPKTMPFDGKRMIFGGFKSIVEF
jgi:uncharacterized protein YbaA (DUF1428 family)